MNFPKSSHHLLRSRSWNIALTTKRSKKLTHTIRSKNFMVFNGFRMMSLVVKNAVVTLWQTFLQLWKITAVLSMGKLTMSFWREYSQHQWGLNITIFRGWVPQWPDGFYWQIHLWMDDLGQGYPHFGKPPFVRCWILGGWNAYVHYLAR